MPEKDAELIVRIILTLKFICEQLENKNVQIKRLLKRIFGIKSEKTKNILKNNSGSEDNTSEGNDLSINNNQKELSTDSKDSNIDSSKNQKNKDEEEKNEDENCKKGHGRNGIDKYTGANVIEVPHQSLKKGDPCPLCPKGKVYPIEPGVFTFIKGKPPVSATIYKTEKLRCNLCGKIFEAKLPKHLPQETKSRKYYDETSKTIIIMLRYGYGFPLHRMAKLQENLGIPLPASTQWDKIEEAADLIHRVFEELKKIAAQGEIIHNDDTGGKILAVMKQIEEEKESGKKGRTGIFTTGIIAIVGEFQIALFFTGRQHAGENTEDVCIERKKESSPLILMSDAKSGNVPKGVDVIECNCNTHARRYFADIVDDFPHECQYVIVEVFGEVYKNERETKEKMMSAIERLEYHQKNSGPVIDDFHIWLNQQIDENLVEPNSSLGKAIKYVLNHWEKLTRFLHVEGVPIDNNICERAIKTVLCHRKNSLFYKNEHGAYIGDMFMSLIHTCTLNDVNAFEYLTELQKNSSKIFKNPSQWLPWNYKEALNNCCKTTENKENNKIGE
ncbi:transposase IS66 [Candidatus Magnetomorum sp. HK-1]|nr:transposase IS66 [Candidatus Magnetomorum sp. HK-1]